MVNTQRLLIDLQDQEAISTYARDCRRRNDDVALRALGRQLIDILVELSPEDPVEWLRGKQGRRLTMGSIEMPFFWDHRRSVSLACDVAELVLPIFEEAYPEDTRPRVAVETTRAWLRGEASVVECHRAAYASAAANASAAAVSRAAYAASNTAAAISRADSAAAAVVVNATYATYASYTARVPLTEHRTSWLREHVIPLIVKYSLMEEI